MAGCPVCSENDFKRYRRVHSRLNVIPDGLDRDRKVEAIIERCRRCGLFRTIPVSDKRSRDKLYQEDSVCFEASLTKIESPNTRSICSTDVFGIMSKRPPAQLLDYGCGAGDFLARASRAGYAVTGVDLDRKAVAYVRDHLHFPVYEGTMDALPADSKFDVIAAFGVLEHIEDPKCLLERFKQHLAPSGELILGVPNVRSLNRWVARLSPHDWDMFIEPGHLYHYHVGTLTRLCRESGFKRSKWCTATLTIRGKIPVLPSRWVTLERFIQRTINRSAVARWCYHRFLGCFDWFKCGDMLFATFSQQGKCANIERKVHSCSTAKY